MVIPQGYLYFGVLVKRSHQYLFKQAVWQMIAASATVTPWIYAVLNAKPDDDRRFQRPYRQAIAVPVDNHARQNNGAASGKPILRSR